MSYRFKTREGVAKGLRRIATSQLSHASDHLRNQGAPDQGAPDYDAAIHDARRSLKRVRAVLHLFQPVLERKLVARNDRALRDAGRVLSATRDSRVIVDTLQRLRERDPRLAAAEHAEEQFARIHERQPHQVAAVLEEAAAAIEAVRKEVPTWRPKAKGWSALGPGLPRIYRRARTAGSEAFADDTLGSDTLHEFRKRVKDHWHALQLLEPCWPELLSAWAAEAKRLSELLGQDHDLALLATAVTAAKGELLDPEVLVAAAEDYGTELRSEARSLAGRLYAETPEAFLARQRAYWRSWRREGRAGKH